MLKQKSTLLIKGEKKMAELKTSFWVEVKDGEVVLIHVKCGRTIEFIKIPFPGGSEHYFYLECFSRRNCMYSGSLILSEQGYENFLRKLKDLENGERIIIQRELISVDSLGQRNAMHSQKLEIFERR